MSSVNISKTVVTLLLLAILSQQVASLDLNMNNKKAQCFILELKQGEKMQVDYEVTGYKAEQFRMTVYDDLQPKAKPIHTINKEKKAEYVIESSKDYKEHKVCFESLDNSGKILQFEFTPLQKKVEAYADDKALQQAFQQANDAYDQMNIIYANLRHSLTKTEMQTKVLESTETKVKWCSVIKMILMIAITGIQIIVLTGLFKDQSPLGI